MIYLVEKVPRESYIAVSGGIDSMTFLHFLIRGGHRPTVLHFNHKTEFGNMAVGFVYSFCKKNNVPIVVGEITKSNQKNTEKFFRDQRYTFLDKFHDKPIVTCHNLNDAVEWWLMSSIKGNPRLIPSRRENYIRPLLASSRRNIAELARSQGTPWIDDPTNDDGDLCDRNYVRHQLMPHIRRLNNGIETTIRNKYLALMKESSYEEITTVAT